jgi:hypothetical protein
MGLMNRSTPEEKEAERQAKEVERAAKDAEKQRDREAKAREKLKKDFFGSPAGQARVAFDGQQQIFQASLDLMESKAIVVAMVGAFSKPKSTTDPTDILNSVAAEGWELVNGSVVFLETGSESRDKFLASGQNIAVSGTIIGYYLFKRCEANRRQTTDPWEAPSAVEAVAAGVEVAT